MTANMSSRTWEMTMLLVAIMSFSKPANLVLAMQTAVILKVQPKVTASVAFRST